jgi:ligand-binding SRPBCC domain-containing protein
VDEMRRGPFKRWRHEHLFEAHEDGCRLTDRIEYEAPLGVLGRLADPIMVRPRLRKMFEYRHRVTREALETG